ncbi:uncharacterized protein A4U43_C01F30530 [Asparagus officinalis]|uniref:Uncharacterized protein n=1 Tax=Asparagus officinalis TaxID=4686 RepID=A0A5P1FTK7_ASPOF|nr:uncharacterized protein A4U43_C01F30530 [Asparagus officinalis]
MGIARSAELSMGGIGDAPSRSENVAFSCSQEDLEILIWIPLNETSMSSVASSFPWSWGLDWLSPSTSSIGLPGVLWVLPDSYLDVPNKDHRG